MTQVTGSWVYAGDDGKGGKEYYYVTPDGKRRSYSDAEIAAAGVVVNSFQKERDARSAAENADWVRPEDRLAASGIDRKPLPSEANKLRPKTRKAPVDKWGWPVKAESEAKKKTDKTTEVVQRVPEPGTGFIQPSVVVGGYSPHAQAPDLWDIAIYKTAHLDGNFINFTMPPIESLKDHLKRLQKELLRLEPDDDLQESASCQIGQFAAAKKIIADQVAGLNYHVSCRATCTVAGFEALKTALLIDTDGTQNPAAFENKMADLRSFSWSGPMQGPAQINQIQLIIPPHIIVEDGSPSAGARALVLRHDGQPPQLIAKRDGGSSAYADIPPDAIPHPIFTFYGPAETPLPGTQIILDLDFFVLGGGRWEVVIVRHM